jgi:hypothetical protein
LLLSLSVAALVAGCQSTRSWNEAEFSSLRENKAAQREAVRQCAVKLRAANMPNREAVAELILSKPETLERDMCDRVLKSIIYGRVTQTEWEAVKQGKISPNVVRLMQGR